MLPRILLSSLPLLMVAACSSTPDVTSVLTPYRVDVRQGNFVTQEMVARLKPGLSREQVRFVLGTPLVADIFHADRWDYVYRFQPGHGEVQLRRLVVYFADDKLVRVGGDVVAEAAVTAGDGATVAVPLVAPVVPATRVIEVPAAPGTAKKD